ncbi:MAG: coenzyme F420-0:L-glutamate ligase [Acidimicrobiales bacterium]|jgi:coenzyme F420-0:L-glutamate ligase/coenzyme F420-1:gamma-L-glutamate ligase
MAAEGSLLVFGVKGLGEITSGTDLAALIAGQTTLIEGDVVVVTQKIVSKAEGRTVRIVSSDPDAKRALAESEAVRVLRRRGDLVVTETRHGFVCANSGVDLSNVADGWAVLLPEDPDRSARRLRDGLRARTGLEVAVIISDTFGRAWRRGVTDVAIGCAGIRAVVDLRGTTDALGRELVATEICVVDEIASAADLVMGKARGVPVAVVRGVDVAYLGQGAVTEEVVRPYGEDLFR